MQLFQQKIITVLNLEQQYRQIDLLKKWAAYAADILSGNFISTSKPGEETKIIEKFKKYLKIKNK
jgi:hypothetical protein